MLYTLAVILLIAWLLGVVGTYTIGAFVHVLLVIALVLFVAAIPAYQLMAQGFSNARIARELDVSEKGVDRAIGVIFQTLELPPSPDEHRRVLAVMRYLNG